MGTSYNRDVDTNLLVAFWTQQRSCKFVEESVEGSGVVFYRNLHGVGVKPKVLKEA
jgi:omega-6 fatty acid desaturase (delta-12 desaturase)